MNNILYKDQDSKYCQDCGQIIKKRAEICPHCGCRQISAYSGRNRIVAVLFAFFLRGFGAHKFYLGSFGLGIVYLIFCWTVIPSIIAIIEGILLLIMSDDDFNRKYNT